MSVHKNTDTMRQKLPDSTWNEIRTAFASGIGLREIARNTGIPEGTVLARANREHWTPEITAAKAKAKARQPDAEQSGAISMAERGQRYLEQLAGVAEKVVPHVSAMQPGEILDRIEKVERFDRMARRTYGLDVEGQQAALVDISIQPGQHQSAPVIDLDSL